MERQWPERHWRTPPLWQTGACQTNWGLTDEFATLHRLMEARMIKMARHELVQVLRLLGL